MDKTKETLAWLRTVFALFVVLDAPLAVWIVQHYAAAPVGLVVTGVLVALLLSAGILAVAILAVQFLHRLGDEP